MLICFRKDTAFSLAASMRATTIWLSLWSSIIGCYDPADFYRVRVREQNKEYHCYVLTSLIMVLISAIHSKSIINFYLLFWLYGKCWENFRGFYNAFYHNGLYFIGHKTKVKVLPASMYCAYNYALLDRGDKHRIIIQTPWIKIISFIMWFP